MIELGPGISTYHQFLVMLFALFCLLTLLHIPVLQNFRSYSYYDAASQGGLIVGSSMGNMGYSKTECLITSMIRGNSKAMKCRSGLITELVDWGVTTHFEDPKKCAKKKEDVCFSVLNNELVQK